MVLCYLSNPSLIFPLGSDYRYCMNVFVCTYFCVICILAPTCRKRLQHFFFHILHISSQFWIMDLQVGNQPICTPHHVIHFTFRQCELGCKIQWPWVLISMLTPELHTFLPRICYNTFMEGSSWKRWWVRGHMGGLKVEGWGFIAHPSTYSRVHLPICKMLGCQGFSNLPYIMLYMISRNHKLESLCAWPKLDQDHLHASPLCFCGCKQQHSPSLLLPLKCQRVVSSDLFEHL